jgi:hypothetical protein
LEEADDPSLANDSNARTTSLPVTRYRRIRPTRSGATICADVSFVKWALAVDGETPAVAASSVTA